MTEALLFVTTGSLLAVGVVTLVIAALTLQDARKSVELAEDCLEYLREERAHLLATLREERRGLEEESKREVRQESASPVAVGSEEPLETHGLSGESPFPARKAREARRTPQPASFPETKGWEPGKSPREDDRTRRGVWMPHPDDAPGRGKAAAPRAQAQSDAPVRMFRKHYDKYLENYQGYVELAEKLCRIRDNGEVAPGSPGEREWEKRLRRVSDGMSRTTARLDILEEHNPELATDDRISRRASLARRHSELEKSRRGSS